jgi:hypothetical protein
MAENLLESCEECFSITINDCADRIFLDAGLSGNLFYRITDKFGNKYWGELAYVEGNSVPYILVSELPAGLFTPHAGAFKLDVFTQMNGCTAEELTFCDTTYSCVLMSFEKSFSV